MTAARLEFGSRRNRLIAGRTEAVRPEFSGRTERDSRSSERGWLLR
jgi:hypothetical protein